MTTEISRAPTMLDVARRAGVSHQTVSRVLNDAPGVRPETRVRIIAAIAQLDYRPNVAARTLVTRRTNSIGILAPAVSDYGPMSTVHSLEAAAAAAGYTTLVTAASGSFAAAQAGLAMLADRAVVGIIVVAPGDPTIEAVAAARTRIPVLTLRRMPSSTAAASIDQTRGVELAVRHLTALGHTRIQHLAGPSSHLEAQERAAAFDAEIALARLPAVPHLTGDWSTRSGFAAARRRDSDATAVFSANDQMAFGLIAALWEDGVAVPTDMSVIGFDDVPEAAYLRPPLTTIRQDFTGLSVAAISQLVALLDGTAVERERIAPTLVVRASTGRRSR